MTRKRTDVCSVCLSHLDRILPVTAGDGKCRKYCGIFSWAAFVFLALQFPNDFAHVKKTGSYVAHGRAYVMCCFSS